MKIYKKIEAYQPNPDKPLFLGLGNFDGIHLGHQAILKEGSDRAHEQKGISSVFTFQEHPQRILHPGQGPALLTSVEYKMYLLEQFGVDECFLVPFTKTFSEIEARDFVQKILVDQLGVAEVRMGHNARFGHDRQGDPEKISEWAQELGFDFQKIEPVSDCGDLISSSRLRKIIADGKLEEAACCLGRSFGFLGEVIQGQGKGKTLGFPTANFRLLSEVMPPHGVYVAKVRLFETQKTELSEGLEDWKTEVGEWQEAVLNYGLRPTVDPGAKEAVLEAHLLDFEGDLYGKKMEVVINKRLRDEKAFEGPEALKQQITEDVAQARRYFRG